MAADAPTRGEPGGVNQRPASAPTAAGVVLASGSGTRVGSAVNKVYLPLGGRRLVSWSLAALGQVPDIGVLVLVTRPQDADLVAEVLDRAESRVAVEVVHGGSSRQESELMALRHLAPRIRSGQVDTVLIHDAARPLVTPELVTRVLRAAREHGGAVPGLPAEDLVTVREQDGAELVEAVAADLVGVQTPQGFASAPLLAAYEQAAREGFAGTDTASCMERFSAVPVRWIPGSRRNFKITYAHDLVVAEQVLADRH
ncbi:IspD/TarI family cytidylyltransferase [Goodfellowiella coeruleoviolacea]|uniref:IspD/TarI family cytidylyltransferase n=1 Tax=Goodfellowiella coeruleoviolacea TaxID=334858 RepID=UPI003899372B